MLKLSALAQTADRQARPFRWNARSALVIGAFLPLALSGCAAGQFKPASSPGKVEEASPLGPSHVLIPAPSDDDSMLGRILTSAPEPGRSIEELIAPNPCAEALEPSKSSAMENSFEDARELAVGAKARATFGMFGLSADVQRATHFVYKLQTEKRQSRPSTTTYAECCKKKDCGYGYVSALVYGHGEYASAEESAGSGGVDMAIASTEGTASLKILSRRKVKGYIAAMVTVTGGKPQPADVLGTAEAAGITEFRVPDQVKALYESERIEVKRGAANEEYVFADGHGAVLTENEFVRRYGKVTGASDLKDAETRRNKTGVLVWGGITAASLVAVVVAASGSECKTEQTYPERKCLEEQSGPGTNPALFWGGVIGTVVGGAFLVPALFKYDGEPRDHRLSEYDAKVYASKHNRALLRRVVKDVEGVNQDAATLELRPAVHLQPWVGAGSLGLSGRF